MNTSTIQQKPWTLVTGGAKRLGAEICRTLASEGVDIVVQYNTSYKEACEVVEQCVQFGVRAECLQGDFSSGATVRQFIDSYLHRFSSTQNLINNVGNYKAITALGGFEEEWKMLFQTNLHTPLALIQALTPSLRHTQGSIVNIGVSGIAILRAKTYSTAYGAAKTALLLATKSLARELAPFSVRVNMVSPGQLVNSVDAHCGPADVPMGRFGTTREVSRVVAFLIQRESQYITGQNIEVAGGYGL